MLTMTTMSQPPVVVVERDREDGRYPAIIKSISINTSGRDHLKDAPFGRDLMIDGSDSDLPTAVGNQYQQ